MDRSDVFYAAAIIALLAVFMATLSAINRRPNDPSDPQSVSTPDDLSAELRRCRALGPGDADEARCQAAWGRKPPPLLRQAGAAAAASCNRKRRAGHFPFGHVQ